MITGVEETNPGIFPYIKFELSKEKNDLILVNRSQLKLRWPIVPKLVELFKQKKTFEINLEGYDYIRLNWSNEYQLWHLNFKKKSLSSSQYGLLYYLDIEKFLLEANNGSI